MYGKAKNILNGIPVAGDLGDQQAALFGQTCFSAGEAKNTYGTGNFLLLNTGTKAVQSKNGLLTTLGRQICKADVVYCLEGAIVITGALRRWFSRDNLGLIKTSPRSKRSRRRSRTPKARYFVPAFSGLFMLYWKTSARGVTWAHSLCEQRTYRGRRWRPRVADT